MKRIVLLAIIVCVTFTACSSSTGASDPNNGNGKPAGGKPWIWTGTPTPAQITTVSKHKVFLAHASVGENTLRGIMRSVPGVNAVQNYTWHSSATIQSAISNSSIVGYEMGPHNGNPADKITEFRNTMNTVVQNRVNIAFMKFCPLDIQGNNSGPSINGYANEAALFNAYKAMISELESTYPNILFVHATLPLYTTNAHYSNIRREIYNDLIREAYGELVFDIAAIEALHSDGKTIERDANGARALAQEWGRPGSVSPDGYFYGNYDPASTDYNHLNTEGQNRMGRSLVAFLAWVAEEYL